jgi:NAD(P) transhydrogenase subunit alpha
MELTAFELLSALFILVLAAFVGYEVVSKVPTMLHTPLMSGANAVHGVIVVGGFVVTDRMLEMFKGRGGGRG